MHDWGYQQNAALLDRTAEPQRLATMFIFGEKTRVVVLNSLDFSLSVEEQLSVGDYSDQRIVFEEIVGTSNVRLRFRALDRCIGVEVDGSVAGVPCADVPSQQWTKDEPNNITPLQVRASV